MSLLTHDFDRMKQQSDGADKDVVVVAVEKVDDLSGSVLLFSQSTSPEMNARL